jgi:hypothetical protein
MDMCSLIGQLFSFCAILLNSREEALTFGLVLGHLKYINAPILTKNCLATFGRYF